MFLRQGSAMKIVRAYRTDEIETLKSDWEQIVRNSGNFCETGSCPFIPTVSFAYDPEHFLYFRARAISADIPNGNGDLFPSAELEKSCDTFIGRGVYFNHNSDDPSKAFGIVLDARWHPVPHKYIEVLNAVDKEVAEMKHPGIVRQLESGILNSTSMSCLCGSALCSVCGNMATHKGNLCPHMNPESPIYCKGRFRSDGIFDVAYETNYEVTFTEDSVVGVPADKTSRIFQVYASQKGLEKLSQHFHNYWERKGTPMEVNMDYSKDSLNRGAAEDTKETPKAAPKMPPAAKAPEVSLTKKMEDINDTVKRELDKREDQKLRNIINDEIRKQLNPVFLAMEKELRPEISKEVAEQGSVLKKDVSAPIVPMKEKAPALPIGEGAPAVPKEASMGDLFERISDGIMNRVKREAIWPFKGKEDQLAEILIEEYPKSLLGTAHEITYAQDLSSRHGLGELSADVVIKALEKYKERIKTASLKKEAGLKEWWDKIRTNPELVGFSRAFKNELKIRRDQGMSDEEIVKQYLVGSWGYAEDEAWEILEQDLGRTASLKKEAIWPFKKEKEPKVEEMLEEFKEGRIQSWGAYPLQHEYFPFIIMIGIYPLGIEDAYTIPAKERSDDNTYANFETNYGPLSLPLDKERKIASAALTKAAQDALYNKGPLTKDQKKMIEKIIELEEKRSEAYESALNKKDAAGNTLTGELADTFRDRIKEATDAAGELKTQLVPEEEEAAPATLPIVPPSIKEPIIPEPLKEVGKEPLFEKPIGTYEKEVAEAPTPLPVAAALAVKAVDDVKVLQETKPIQISESVGVRQQPISKKELMEVVVAGKPIGIFIEGAPFDIPEEDLGSFYKGKLGYLQGKVMEGLKKEEINKELIEAPSAVLAEAKKETEIPAEDVQKIVAALKM